MDSTRRSRSKSKERDDTAGRPPSQYGKKSTRSFYLSDSAYNSLHYLAEEHCGGNISELLEMITRHKDALNLPEDELHREFGTGTIFWRLRMLLREPAGIFWSLLAFAERFARQRGLEVNEEFLIDIFLRTMSALFCLDYLSPNKPSIDSLSSRLRWHLFHIIQNASESERRIMPPDTTSKQAYRMLLEQDRYGNTRKDSREQQQLQCIATIYQARNKLMKQGITSSMNALRLRVSHGYTLEQIERVCRAQGDVYTGVELLKYGIDTFRKFWLRKEDITTDIEEKPRRKLKKAFRYCELLQQTDLTKSEADELKNLLIGGLEHLDHSNWANEIDYFFTYVVPPLDPFLDKHKENIRQRIVDAFDIHLLKTKQDIDRKLAEDIPMSLGSHAKTSFPQFLKARLEEELKFGIDEKFIYPRGKVEFQFLNSTD